MMYMYYRIDEDMSAEFTIEDLQRIKFVSDETTWGGPADLILTSGTLF